jgi:hypothetical protein
MSFQAYTPPDNMISLDEFEEGIPMEKFDATTAKEIGDDNSSEVKNELIFCGDYCTDVSAWESIS